MTLSAYSKISKAAFLADLRAHQEADRLVQCYGYWKDGKGCAVGCSVQSINTRLGLSINANDHAALADMLDIPEWLARMEDNIFESQAVDQAREWPVRFASAIPEGADLSGVWPLFAVWLMRDVVMPSVPEGFADVRVAVERVAAGYETGWAKDRPEDAAANAAADAASYAAYAAAYAANAANAAYAIAYAANAAAKAAYATDTKVAVWARIADKLCDLIAACKPATDGEES